MAPQSNSVCIKSDTAAALSREMDPINPGTGVRIAFAAEAVLNLILAVPMVLDPRSAMQGQFLPMFDRTTDVLGTPPSPEAASMTQYLGACMLAMAAALFVGIPNRPGAVEVRRSVYAMLAVLEIVFVPIVAWQIWIAGEDASGVGSKKAIGLYMVPLPIACSLRLWTLFVKPEWMGKYIVKRTD